MSIKKNRRVKYNTYSTLDPHSPPELNHRIINERHLIISLLYFCSHLIYAMVLWFAILLPIIGVIYALYSTPIIPIAGIIWFCGVVVIPYFVMYRKIFSTFLKYVRNEKINFADLKCSFILWTRSIS